MDHCTKTLRNDPGSLHTCDSPTVLCSFMSCAHAVDLILLLSKHNSIILYFPWAGNEKLEPAGLTCFVFNTMQNKIPHDIFYISSGLVWGFLNYNGIHCIEAQKKRDSRNFHTMLNVTNKGIPKSVYTTGNTSHVTHSARILSPRGWMNRYCKFRLVSFS